MDLKEMSLDQLADLVRELTREVEKRDYLNLDDAIRSGEALLAAKARVRQGRWKAWVTDLGLRYETVATHMRLATFAVEIRQAGCCSVAESLRYLRGTAKERDRGFQGRFGQTERLLMEMRRAEGATIAAIAAEFETSSKTVRTTLDPKVQARYNSALRMKKAEAKAAERALQRERQAAEVAAIGGDGSREYADLRKILARLDRVIGAAPNATSKKAFLEALSLGHRMEDALGRGIREAALVDAA